MKVWERGGNFLDALLADKEVTRALPEKMLRAQFDLDYHLKHVDTIFDRVFGKGSAKKRARSLACTQRPQGPAKSPGDSGRRDFRR